MAQRKDGIYHWFSKIISHFKIMVYWIAYRTSGGTESIILAIKSHRDFYTKKYGISHPEMVACITAHAAVDKACDLMGIKLIKVAMDPKTGRANVSAVRNAIGPNTIMVS